MRGRILFYSILGGGAALLVAFALHIQKPTPSSSRHRTAFAKRATEAAPYQRSEFRGRVEWVEDGDTIVVQYGRSVAKVRLFGIDCPETREGFGTDQPFGQEAAEFTKQLVEGKIVTVRVLGGPDKWGRTIGKVLLGSGEVLDYRLVKAGLAWWSRGWARNEPNLKRLEEEARAARRGLWGSEHPMHPYDFRAMVHERNSGK